MLSPHLAETGSETKEECVKNPPQFSAKNAASAENVRSMRVFFDMCDGADRSVSQLQGEHGGLRLDFVNFHSEVLPGFPFAMPSLRNFHLSRQKWHTGTNHIKANKT